MTTRIRTHPGANLKDCLEAAGWSVNEFAARLGVSHNTASRLLNGRCGISPAVALALERISWSTADFWLRRQASYELSVARRRMEEGAIDANPYEGAVLPPDAIE
jgi:HTH-type transcriptional regulator/antitoxin HigA